jgi:hypothetical protein
MFTYFTLFGFDPFRFIFAGGHLKFANGTVNIKKKILITKLECFFFT